MFCTVKRTFTALLAAALLLTLLPFALASNAAEVTSGDYTYSIEDGNATIVWYIGSVATLVVPSTLDGYPVTNIGDNAFEYCDTLVDVTFPAGVVSIGQSAFNSCSALESVTFPASVTSIGADVFDGCYLLKSINVNDGNAQYASIDGVLFDAAKTTLLQYPIGKTDTSYVIPAGVTSIGDRAFCYCAALWEVTIPLGVTSIGNNAFENCNSLTNVDIPSSVKSIGESAFVSCSSFTGVTVPLGVTSIGEDAFSWCSSLVSVTLPSSVTSIGGGAFASCGLLTSISVDSGNACYVSVDDVLFSKDRSILVQYPTGKTAAGYVIPNSVTSIGKAAFKEGRSLTSVTIPNSVTSIGVLAFSYCTKLKSVGIPSSVTTIEHHAFFGCGLLTIVTIPSSVTSIGDLALGFCERLSTVSFLGAPPSEVGENLLLFCAEGCTIYYPASFASAWAPNGETTWNGYPIVLYVEPPYIAVTNAEGMEVKQYIRLDAEAGLLLNLPPQTTAEMLKAALGEELLTQCTGLLKTGDIVFYQNAQYRVIVMGDVDKTGTVNAADAAVILRATVKLESLDALQLAAANLGFATSYTAADAAKILRYSVKLEPTLGKVG